MKGLSGGQRAAGYRPSETTQDREGARSRVIWRSLRVALLMLVALGGCGQSDDPIVLFQNGDYDASFRIFSARAAAGDIVASNYLGLHYYLGAGVGRDFTRAAEWFEVAALAEYPEAQRNLGVMYLRGLGVEQDYHKAYGWLHFAHVGGNQGARDYLDLMVDNVTPNASGNARKHVRERIKARAVAQSKAGPAAQ
jgi:TPR repeat protein